MRQRSGHLDWQITTAIITAIIAILIAILGNIFTFFNSKSQIKQNEKKNQEELKINLDRFREGWVTDLQTTYELEMVNALRSERILPSERAVCPQS